MKLLRSITLIFACLTVLHAEPFRKPIERDLAHAGWVQLSIDPDFHADIHSLWLADAAGNSVSYLHEAALPAWTRSLRTSGFISGKNAAGETTAEFEIETLTAGAAANVETMEISLTVDAQAPWAAEAFIEVLSPSGEWLTAPTRQHLYNFGGSNQQLLALNIAAAAKQVRVRLRSVQGEIKTITAASVQTNRWKKWPTTVAVTEFSKEADGLRVRIPAGARRVVGCEVDFENATAPLQVAAEIERHYDGERAKPYRVYLGSGAVWRLDAIASTQTRIDFSNAEYAETFFLKLPAEARVKAVRAIIREEHLWFLAEKGVSYFAHFGGVVRPAAGNLAALPNPGDLLGAQQGVLGARQADPFGEKVVQHWTEKLRRFLPFIVIGGIALLAIAARRLLMPPKSPN